MKYNSQGISLIEIMVSLLISMFLMLAVTQIYLKNKKTYAFEVAISEMQDSADFSQLTFENWLYKAGFRRGIDVPMSKSFPAQKYEVDDYSCQFSDSAIITTLSGKNGFCIRYQPSSENEVDCEGSKVKYSDELDTIFKSTDPNYLVVLAFEHESENNKNNGKLYCKNLNSSTVGASKVELLDHVADMSIEVGWATSLNDEFSRKVEIFSPITEWSKSRKVQSFRYALLIASKDNQAQSKSVGILSEWKKIKKNSKASVNDNYQLYKIVTSTLVLKGVAP